MCREKSIKKAINYLRIFVFENLTAKTTTTKKRYSLEN